MTRVTKKEKKIIQHRARKQSLTILLTPEPTWDPDPGALTGPV